MRIPIDLARFERDLNDLAAIGATAQGGVTRRSFTPADQTGRAFVERRMMDAGLRTWVDAAGNIHGRRPGRSDGPPVMMGSHVDTVENGGRYDGAVGILGAIEVIRALEDAACDALSSLEVVCFHAEEPSRFGFSCFGSKAMAGTLCDPDILDRRDPDGRSLAEALVEMGRDPARLCEARQSPGDIAAYVELHVEQGKVLETQGVSLGVVTDIAASSRYRVTFRGEAVHAGGTPMGQRKDALAAAAEAILVVERVCERYGRQDIVGTVGIVHSRPAMMNVVPGFAEIYFEVRGRVHYPKSQPMAEIREALEGIGRRRGVGVVVEILMEDEARAMSPGILAVIQRCAEDQEVPYLLMPSRTGHDALQVAHIAETGMIFLPSRGGIGHDPGEWTAPEEIGRGLALLADTVVTLARSFACTASGERASGAGVARGTASVSGSVSRPSEG